MILNWLYETVLAWLGKDPKYIARDTLDRTNRAMHDQVEGWVDLKREEAQDSLVTLAKGKHLPGHD